ncbi:MAG: acylphosphatase [Nanoarchaeota archaeon]|nr:acylphosphatase [Nanoarchaeota archaeon]
MAGPIRMTAIVSGRVQRDGFRELVRETAYHWDVDGIVRYLPDGTVRSSS